MLVDKFADMKLLRTDLLQVTAQSCGVILLTFTLSGVSEINDVFREVRKETAAAGGAASDIVTVKLRNRTQGWTRQHNLVLKRQPGGTHIPESGRRGAGGAGYPSLFN